MFKYRKRKKSRFLIILFAFVVSISLGYAYLERTLNINGSSYLAGNTWKIQFDNFVVTEGSVEPTSPVTFDDKKANINFGVDLNLPGEFYEFTVDIVNKGTIGASLDTFTKTTLTAEQQKYLVFTATYIDGSPIVVGDFLDKDKSISIKVRVEYVRYFNENEVVPSTDQYIDLNLAFKFVQDDGLTKDFMKRIKLNAKVDDFVNFGNAPSSSNGEGVMIKSDTKNDENPIYYYRGNVTNNNVRWADKCWKIIRTTDTGGVKMIYNGLPAANGSCNNSGYAAALSSTSNFNNFSTPSSVGYMYGMTPSSSSIDFYDYPFSLSVGTSYNYYYYYYYNGGYTSYYNNYYYYSSSVTWDEETGLYTLDSPSSSSTYFPKGAYTCGTSTSCSAVKYVYDRDTAYSYSGSYTYYYTLYVYREFENGELRNPDDENIVLCTSYSYSVNSSSASGYNYTPTNCTTYTYSTFPMSSLSSTLYACPDLTTANCTSSSLRILYTTQYTYYEGGYGMWLYTGVRELSNQSMLFARNVTYEDGIYKLVDPISRVWKNNYSLISEQYPYSCFSSSDTCSSVNYIFDYAGSRGVSSYTTFSNGDVMTNDYLNSMFTSDTSSVIKNNIDSWYASNLINYSDNIEDVVYCNDRSNSGLNTYSSFTFNSPSRFSNAQFSLECSNLSDSFTVSGEIGNGKLTYPIGLITADEAYMAGAANSSTYLYSNNYDYFTMTPYSKGGLYYLNNRLYSYISPTRYSYVRPVISIKGNFTIKGGNGTVNSPFSIV